MIEECRLHGVGLHCGSKSIGLSVLSFTGPCYGQTKCTNFFGGSIERMQFAFRGIHGSMKDSSMQPDRELRSCHASTRSLCSNICFARPSFPPSRLLHPQYLHHKTQHSPILILTRSITSASQSSPFPHQPSFIHSYHNMKLTTFLSLLSLAIIPILRPLRPSRPQQTTAVTLPLKADMALMPVWDLLKVQPLSPLLQGKLN